MNMNKLYLITTNDKKFDEWSKQMRNALKKESEVALDHFNHGFVDIQRGNYLVRASFVCFWEMAMNDSLNRMKLPITQATLVHLSHRLLEQGRAEDAQTVVDIISTIHTLLAVADNQGDTSEEE